MVEGGLDVCYKYQQTYLAQHAIFSQVYKDSALPDAKEKGKQMITINPNLNHSFIKN